NVTGVRAEVIHRLLDDGLTPVVSTVGANAAGQPYNVNADEAARAIAVAMKAEKIVYLTAVPGLLEDSKDESTLIHRLTAAELRERIAHESVGKGMIPKLRACADAVEQGVPFYFEKPSTRTRNSMEMAVAQLGGHPVYLQPAELGIGTRESVEDVTRTLACYHAIIAARVFDHGLLEQMAAVNAAPLLNMLS